MKIFSNSYDSSKSKLILERKIIGSNPGYIRIMFEFVLTKVLPFLHEDMNFKMGFILIIAKKNIYLMKFIIKKIETYLPTSESTP